MKLTILLLTVCILQVSATGFAQQVSLSETNAPLTQIFKKIQQQTGFDFFASDDLLAASRPVTINVKNADLSEVLKLVFNDQPVAYQLGDHTVTLKAREETFWDRVREKFTAIDVRGRVLDDTGLPLPGANIQLKDGTRATTTEANGSFLLRDVTPGTKLVITFVGFSALELTAAKEMGDIRLQRAQNKLDEVQIIGYGTSTQRLNTGNVTSIKADVIEKQPVTNPILALEGRVPGLIITQQSGIPGGSISVQLRGQNSISQNSNPLFIVDGVPYPNNLLASAGTAIIGNGSPLNYINPQDIESIDVLKDADATAIYGSRAANGVILITTKKGRAGAPKFDINAYTGVTKVGHQLPMMNAQQYLEMRREAYKNTGTTPNSVQYDLNGTWDTNRDVNWEKKLIGQDAHQNNIQTSLSGGNEMAQYTAGLNYNKNGIMFPGNYSSQRMSGRLGLDVSSRNKKFHTSLSANYNTDWSLFPTVDLTGTGAGALVLSPVAPEPLNPDGSINWANGTFNVNPYQYLYSFYKGKTSNLIASGRLSYRPIKGLEIATSFGYTNLQANEVNALTIKSQVGFPGVNNPTGSSAFANNNMNTLIIEPQISYTTFVLGGELKALVGATDQQNRTSGDIVNAAGYVNDTFLESMAGAATLTRGNSTYTQYKYAALYGRLNYTLKNRYLFNLTARRDGSSRFASGRQFGNFGAVGMGWIFSEEQWLHRHLPALSFGKLRASYGTVGNQPGSDYAYLELYRFNAITVPYQGGTALAPQNIFAPDFAWELTRKLEFGLELGFLDNRISGTISYYRNRSGNQLLNYQLPDVTGFRTITANMPALVQNKGLEVTLTTENIRGKDFSWNTNFNISAQRNKLVSFPGQEKTTYSNLVVGQSLSVKKLYHFLQVDPATGIYQFQAANGAVVNNPVYGTDNTVLFDLNPKYYGGINNSFRYHRFTLDLSCQFVKQKGVSIIFTPGTAPGTSKFNWPEIATTRWQKPGDISPYQQYTSVSSGTVYNAYIAAQSSDYAYIDASFIRLKNVSLSYQLPDKWLSGAGIQNLRVYFQGQNLFTWTKYNGIDPENQSVTSLPPLQVFTAGFQVSL